MWKLRCYCVTSTFLKTAYMGRCPQFCVRLPWYLGPHPHHYYCPAAEEGAALGPSYSVRRAGSAAAARRARVASDTARGRHRMSSGPRATPQLERTNPLMALLVDRLPREYL